MTASRAALYRAAAGITRRLCLVPERDTTTEWAVKYRELPETGGTRGRYRIETVPYHRRAQDLMTDPAISLVVLCWASQTGKSTCIENAIGTRIHQRPGPMLIVRPKIDDAESWAKERFDPMVRATPVLRDRVRLDRGGSTMRYKVFPGGYAFIPSAQSATELASRSAPDLYIDEADRMEVIKGEGNPIAIVMRRNAATDIGTTVITSTPRDAATTMIWPYLEGGTYEHFEVPCPHCDHRQPLIWGTRERDAGLRWAYGQPRTAAYLCRACLTTFGEKEKPAMLLAGEWAATNPDAEYPSLHLNGLYSPFAKSSWAVLAQEWESAQGKPADLQVFVNTRLAEPWEEPAEAVDETTLNARRESIEEGTVPDGVGVLTAGVDVQEKYIEAFVWGWGMGLESWPITSIQIAGDPSEDPGVPGSVWEDLDRFLLRSFRHVSGQQVPIRAAFVDSGYQASKVYAFTGARVRRRVFASKGVGGEGMAALGKPSAQGKARALLYPVGVDGLKVEFLRSQVHVREPGPGFVHVPEWLTDDQIAGLLSEKRVTRIVKGRAVREWVKRSAHARNEPLDCRNYARGALETLGPRTIGRLAAMAAELSVRREDVPTAIESDEPSPLFPPRQPQRKRGSWVTRY